MNNCEETYDVKTGTRVSHSNTDTITGQNSEKDTATVQTYFTNNCTTLGFIHE